MLMPLFSFFRHFHTLIIAMRFDDIVFVD